MEDHSSLLRRKFIIDGEARAVTPYRMLQDCSRDGAAEAEWKWNTGPVGNLAALYASIESATSYIDALGLYLDGYSFAENPGGRCLVSFKAVDAGHPKLGKKRRCPSTLIADPSSWIIYIPFDTCDYRLGGSVLSEETGARSSLGPDIYDADYFIDCFEVVRELVEDGIVLSGATVCDGGLITALKGMCRQGTGAAIDITSIRDARGELPSGSSSPRSPASWSRSVTRISTMSMRS